MELALVLLFSLVGGVGAVAFSALILLLSESARKLLLPGLVGYATGSLLGAAFLGLLPSASEKLDPHVLFPLVLGGIVAFFALEKIVLLRHCHEGVCETHRAAGPLILVGDSFHNFVDGIAIAAAFQVSTPVGIMTALAAASHEVPQEVGDFTILLQSGFSRARAFAYNILSGLAATVGALVGWLFLDRIQPAVPYFLAVAASGFLYVAMADLVPHLQRETATARRSVIQVAAVVAGMGSILLLQMLAGHSGHAGH